jgi:DNA-directed RNA polymerase specialized sigma24 family protein
VENTLDDQIVRSLFWMAILLSAESKQAKTAVVESIASLEPEDLSTEALLICVAHLSIRQTFAFSDHSEAFEGSLSLLPQELQAVLHLRAKLRHCFVFHILQGLSVETCSATLQVSADEIGVSICAAVLELARSRQGMWMSSIPAITILELRKGLNQHR